MAPVKNLWWWVPLLNTLFVQKLTHLSAILIQRRAQVGFATIATIVFTTMSQQFQVYVWVKKLSEQNL